MNPVATSASLVLHWHLPTPGIVVIEPWADEFEVRPGQKFGVRFEGIESEEVVIEYRPESVVIWGLPRSTYVAYTEDSDATSIADSRCE